jgi:hypothetical protein
MAPPFGQASRTSLREPFRSLGRRPSCRARYIDFYNSGRPHRAHKGRTPDAAYFGNQDMKAAA